ncbi:hypothetical protein [Johnsonella ignava]|uniref:hypothetical protein n=1 Tax=Johnsonella ignava TaxID=43995 RepID=UPI0023F4DC90|nr:hypothetical protein [Johnsonella ignava]
MLAKKVNGELENLKRAIRVLKKEIRENEIRIKKLHPIKDAMEIKRVENIILKKNKQKFKLEKKIG